MAVVWLVYILALIIFSAIGWTGVFHARNYSMPGDLTKKAAFIYIGLMIFIVVLTVMIVLGNGIDASFNMQNIKFNLLK